MSGFAQSDCKDCPCIILRGERLAGEGDYIGAIRQYNSAKICDAGHTQELNRRIEELFKKIDKLRKEAVDAKAEAEKSRKQAELNAKRAKAAEQEARVNAIRANEAVIISHMATDSAMASAKLARQEAERADAERAIAQAALLRLQKAFVELTDIYVRQANDFIYALQYDSAATIITEASLLRVASKSSAIASVYLELIYFYNETGQTEQAVAVLDTFFVWSEKGPAPLLGPSIPRDSLRMLLSSLDPLGFIALEKKYYPSFLKVEGGTFMMGSSDKEKEKEGPAHKVTLSNFDMAETETTWWQYYLFVLSTKKEIELPGWGTKGDNPAVNVTWYDAVAYANWLNARFGKEPPILTQATTKPDSFSYSLHIQAPGYRLPTEAEWEYAARGGKEGMDLNHIYSGSDDVNEVAIKGDNNRTYKVRSKNANMLGLYDMTGNVWEWCWDWYEEYSKKSQIDPTGAPSPNGGTDCPGCGRINRGGGWQYTDVEVTYRAGYDYAPDHFRDYIGFRLARTH